MKFIKKQAFLVIVFFCAITLTTCTSLTPEETLYLNEMLEYAQQRIDQVSGSALRDIHTDYENHILGPNPLFLLLFAGANQLHLPVFPYESERITTACMSQFESPPGSSIFWDFAFVVRPNANLRAPIMHGDAGGVGGATPSFSMDFYNVNPDHVTVDEFFGDQLDKINQALILVEPYQRIGEDRGEWTPHLDPYKSDYRIEMEEPEDADDLEKQAYAEAAVEAFKLFYDAYLTSLEENIAPEDDQDLIQGNKEGADEIIDLLYEEDFVAQMGPRLFQSQEAFDKYFLNAFWRRGYYGEGL
jgi:hypothetical protein